MIFWRDKKTWENSEEVYLSPLISALMAHLRALRAAMELDWFTAGFAFLWTALKVSGCSCILWRKHAVMGKFCVAASRIRLNVNTIFFHFEYPFGGKAV